MRNLIKRIASIGLFGVMAIGATSIAFGNDNNVRINLNGSTLNTEAVIVDGRTLVPARAITENLGGTTQWFPEEQIVGLMLGNISLYLKISNTNAVVNTHPGDPFELDETVRLDVPPMIIEGRTLIPLRFVAEQFGLYVGFENGTVLLNNVNGAVASNNPTSLNQSQAVTINGQEFELIQFSPSQPSQPTTTNPSTPPSQPTTTEPARTSLIPTDRRINDSELEQWKAQWHSDGGATEFELEVIRLINEIRVEHGLNPLQIDDRLMMAARFHSEDLHNLRSTGVRLESSHITPHHNTVSYRAVMFGFGAMAENIGSGANPTSVVLGWMNSEGHRKNILNAQFYIGIGAGLGDGGIITLKSW